MRRVSTFAPLIVLSLAALGTQPTLSPETYLSRQLASHAAMCELLRMSLENGWSAQNIPTQKQIETALTKVQACVDKYKPQGLAEYQAAIKADPIGKAQMQNVYARWIGYMNVMAGPSNERETAESKFNEAANDMEAWDAGRVNKQ